MVFSQAWAPGAQAILDPTVREARSQSGEGGLTLVRACSLDWDMVVSPAAQPPSRSGLGEVGLVVAAEATHERKQS
jgi:hypothetical protein